MTLISAPQPPALFFLTPSALSFPYSLLTSPTTSQSKSDFSPLSLCPSVSGSISLFSLLLFTLTTPPPPLPQPLLPLLLLHFFCTFTTPPPPPLLHLLHFPHFFTPNQQTSNYRVTLMVSTISTTPEPAAARKCFITSSCFYFFFNSTFMIFLMGDMVVNPAASQQECCWFDYQALVLSVLLSVCVASLWVLQSRNVYLRPLDKWCVFLGKYLYLCGPGVNWRLVPGCHPALLAVTAGRSSSRPL